MAAVAIIVLWLLIFTIWLWYILPRWRTARAYKAARRNLQALVEVEMQLRVDHAPQELWPSSFISPEVYRSVLEAYEVEIPFFLEK